MKTITEINTKWWYRLVKVIFILLFAIVLLIANGLIFSQTDFKQISLDKTKISCTYGDKKEFMASEASPYLLSSDDFKGEKFDYKYYFERYGNEYNIRDILNNCYTPENEYFDVFAMQRVYEVYGAERLKIRGTDRPPLTEDERQYLDQEITKIESAYGSSKYKYLDYSVKLFDISPVFSHIPFLKTFLLTNLIILAVFEVIRRAFYYIILGSLRPKK